VWAEEVRNNDPQIPLASLSAILDGMAAAGRPSSTADASYLCRLLERQPACLVRVRLDGVLLACNGAALALFGVGTLGAILNTNLADRITAAEREKWEESRRPRWRPSTRVPSGHRAQ
jgi:hypothetical protein